MYRAAVWLGLGACLAGLVADVLGETAATRPDAGPLYTVTRLGAVGDGMTLNTRAIQSAIDAANAAGGGTVFFPAGRFLCGSLTLKSNVTLHLDNGAVLLGSTDSADYPQRIPAYRSCSDEYVSQALLYSEKSHDIVIEGTGTIDGQGGHPAFKCVDPNYRMRERPYLIRFVECTNVRVRGVTLRDSAMWVQHYLACDNVALEGLTVLSNCNNNNDMIDIDGCHDVTVIGCKGETGDDAITLKSTGPRTCERITIANCTVSTPCSGIKLGTESIGGFRDVVVTNCIVRRPLRKGHCNSDYTQGINIATVDGGVLERVSLSNITVEGAVAAVYMRLGHRGRPYMPGAPKPDVGTFRDVVISNLIARGTRHNGCSITGLTEHALQNVTLRNVQISFEGGGKLPDATREVPEMAEKSPTAFMFGRLPAYGLYVRHVDGLNLDNVQLGFDQPDYRPALICEDVRRLSIHNLQAAAVSGGAETIRLNDVEGALVTGCVAPQPGVPFMWLGGKASSISVIGNDLSRASRAFLLPEALDSGMFFEAANRMPPGER